MKRLLVVLFATFCSFNVMASPVNVNTADAKTIAEALSGIGLKKAQAIVKYREEKGAFKTVDDLDNVDGFGPKTIAKIKNDVLLSDSLAPGAAPAPASEPASVPAPAPEQKTDKKAAEKTK